MTDALLRTSEASPALHGRRDAQQAKHALVLRLRTAGHTYEEIALRAGLSRTGVFNICRRYLDPEAKGARKSAAPKSKVVSSRRSGASLAGATRKAKGARAEANADPAADTRSVIIRRAAELFARGDYAGTSISDIATAVGVSKPALYHHFSDKEALYFEIVNPVLRDMCVNAEAVVSDKLSPREQLREYMHAHARYVDENLAACAAAQIAFRGLKEKSMRRAALQWRDRHEQVLRGILQRGVEDGSFDGTDIHSTARAIISIMNGFPLWFRPSGPKRAEEFADIHYEFLLRGLLPRDSDTRKKPVKR